MRTLQDGIYPVISYGRMVTDYVAHLASFDVASPLDAPRVVALVVAGNDLRLRCWPVWVGVGSAF